MMSRQLPPFPALTPFGPPHRCPQALRELSAVQADDEMRLACLAAMIQAHQAAKIVDDEAVLDLQSKMEVQAYPSAASLFLPPSRTFCPSLRCAPKLPDSRLPPSPRPKRASRPTVQIPSLPSSTGTQGARRGVAAYWRGFSAPTPTRWMPSAPLGGSSSASR